MKLKFAENVQPALRLSASITFAILRYDNVGGDNWALMGQPSSASGDGWVDLSVGGTDKALSPIGVYAEGQLPPESSITPRYDSLLGGPADMSSLTGEKVIASQRILWPRGGSFMEEVVGTDTQRFSDHWYWSWYDKLSAGYSNWVLVANPSATLTRCWAPT